MKELHDVCAMYRNDKSFGHNLISIWLLAIRDDIILSYKHKSCFIIA